jgi:hypothetical protein
MAAPFTNAEDYGLGRSFKTRVILSPSCADVKVFWEEFILCSMLHLL